MAAVQSLLDKLALHPAMQTLLCLNGQAALINAASALCAYNHVTSSHYCHSAAVSA